MTLPLPADGRSTRLRGARQHALHALLVAGGWVGFFWAWKLVTSNAPELGQLQLLIVGAGVVVPVLTVSWILHNVGIHRRKGPRRSVPRVDTRYTVDFNGRRIVADWQDLRRARHVEVEVDDDVKRYHGVAVDLERAA